MYKLERQAKVHLLNAGTSRKLAIPECTVLICIYLSTFVCSPLFAKNDDAKTPNFRPFATIV